MKQHTFKTLPNISNKAVTRKPLLQLLVISLHEVVQVMKIEHEQGMWARQRIDAFQSQHTRLYQTFIFECTFEKLREQIEELAVADNPVPRIEALPNANYRMYVGKHMHYFSPSEYQALSELAGKPLPIYAPTKGKWDELTETSNPCHSQFPFKAWRYTVEQTEA